MGTRRPTRRHFPRRLARLERNVDALLDTSERVAIRLVLWAGAIYAAYHFARELLH